MTKSIDMKTFLYILYFFKEKNIQLLHKMKNIWLLGVYWEEYLL